MEINRAKFERVVTEAKARTSDRRWLNAIEKAADALLKGKWIVTELHDSIAITTESGETYFVNDTCGCKAFHDGQPCKHRAAARLIGLYNAAPELKAPTKPRIVRSIERDYNGTRVQVIRCDGWVI